MIFSFFFFFISHIIGIYNLLKLKNKKKNKKKNNSLFIIKIIKKPISSIKLILNNILHYLNYIYI